MNIAVLAHLHHPIREPYLGGTEMHTALVVDELVSRGHQVTLYAKGGSETSARLAPVLAEDFVFGATPGPDGADRSGEVLDAAVSEAIGAIRASAAEAVLNNSLGPLPYTLLDGVPTLTVLHTPPTLERITAVITADDWRPDPRHRWVSVSEFNATAWRELLPAVEAVPNGIRLDAWCAHAGTGDPDLAAWAARITPEKGLHLAIEAADQAGVRLEISGPISDPGYFAELIAPRLSDRIRWLGHAQHRELAARLRRAGVFVSSSVWPEPFGLSLVEAMACGTPVAAFPTGAAPEIVTAGAGVLAREITAASLADAMADARRLDRTVVRSRAERFDARLMVDRYQTLLRELIS